MVEPFVRPEYYEYQDDDKTFREMVLVSKMFLEPTHQYGRSVTEAAVNKILRSGYVRNLSVVYLSYRNDLDLYAIVDGNHRVEVAKKLGIDRLDSKVYIDLTVEQEAEYYVKLNSYKHQTSLDRFRAKIVQKDPDALEIKDMLAGYGLYVAPSMGSAATNAILAVYALEKVQLNHGTVGLRDIIDILYGAWGNSRRAWISPMIEGMRQFWMRYHPVVKKEQLIDRLKLMTPERVLADASVGVYHSETSGSRIGKVVLYQYNKGRRPESRLPEWVTNPTQNAEHMRTTVVPARKNVQAKQAQVATEQLEFPNDNWAF